MASIKLKGDVSGEVTISAPAVAGTTTLTLPATSSTLATQNSLGVRNLVINGDMRIDQRNAGGSVTPSNLSYGIDRWRNRLSVSSKYSVQQNVGSVTPPEGFTNYLGVTSLSSYSVVSADYFAIEQPIEGLNFSHLNYGTANAKTVTFSFWVRSSLTGTFGASFRNNTSDYNYPFSYTISSANTWEKKTITISGATSGTWLTNNSTGLIISFNLGVGSTYTGTGDAWNASVVINPTGATNLLATNGATFYITGIQLEVGTEATPFEHRPYDMELARCQRYYTKQYFRTRLVLSVTTVAEFTVSFKQSMRAAPALSTTPSLGTVASITNSPAPADATCYISFNNHASNNYACTWEANAEL